MGGKGGEEFYSPGGGYPPHDVGGEAYLRPSSRLLEPAIQSPYGPPDPGAYRKPAGPQVSEILVELVTQPCLLFAWTESIKWN